MKKRTFGFFVDLRNYPSYLVPEDGYHVCKKVNGKKVPFKVEWVEDGNCTAGGYYYVTCASWAGMRTIKRRIFGWR